MITVLPVQFFIKQMTDTTPTAIQNKPPAKPRRGGRGNQPRQAPSQGPSKPQAGNPGVQRTHPILEQLAALYPHLFGEVFLPLKRGIFQDLLAAHPDVLDRDGLKAALALHTRSTRYLVGVAAGHKRHDLQGNAVEDMAPEHVYQALLEVFRRRQGRTNEDLGGKLRNRIIQAFEASGLSRADYQERMRTHNEAANAVLDEALAEVGARAAKDEALRRAFEASGQTVEIFAENYGMDVQSVNRALERARRAAQ
jgi:sRNA-binding protein